MIRHSTPKCIVVAVNAAVKPPARASNVTAVIVESDSETAWGDRIRTQAREATRPTTAPRGRVLPAQLTAAGRKQLQVASRAVRHVEQQMLSPMSAPRQRRLRTDLAACVAALSTIPPVE